MDRSPLVVPATTRSKDSQHQDSTWRKRSLLRVRRPSWATQAKPPAGR